MVLSGLVSAHVEVEGDVLSGLVSAHVEVGGDGFKWTGFGSC